MNSSAEKKADYETDSAYNIKTKDRVVAVISGVKMMLPFLTSAVPLGFLGGAYGVAAGLTTLQTMSLAILVNSGTVQFVGTKMIQDGGNWAVIISTSVILSLRLTIYSALIRDHVRDLGLPWKSAIGFGLIDAVFFAMQERESRVVNLHPREWRWTYIGATGTMFFGWMLATYLGVLLGDTIPNIRQYGLEFPMTALFIAMLAGTLKSAELWLVAAVAGVAATVLHGLPLGIGLLVATIFASAVGVAFVRCREKKSA